MKSIFFIFELHILYFIFYILYFMFLKCTFAL